MYLECFKIKENYPNFRLFILNHYITNQISFGLKQISNTVIILSQQLGSPMLELVLLS